MDEGNATGRILPKFHPLTHRKRVEHFDVLGTAHELTFSCHQRLPLLTESRVCVLLSQAIGRAIERHEFSLVAFVFMPEHVHLLVFPWGGEGSVSGLLYAIKRPFSFRVKEFWAQTDPKRLAELTIRERPGRETFRFWQEGGGYDRNIDRRETLRATIDYIHNNPVRRGLVQNPADWKWSSWRFYCDPTHKEDADLPIVHGLPKES